MVDVNKNTLSSLETQLGRIEERLNNLIDMRKEDNLENTQGHKEIMGKIDTLCIHVNHENELMTQRINELELHGTEFLRITVANLAKDTKNALAVATNTTDNIKNRITVLEKDRDANTAERKGQKKIWIYTTAIVGFTISILTLARLLGIF